jgi:outer membrane protein TolC
MYTFPKIRLCPHVRHRLFRHWLLLFFFSFFFIGETAAAERTLTLPEALKIALEENHELKAFTNAVSAEKEGIGVARSFLLPKITLEERFLRTTNPTYAFMAKLNQERFTSQDFEVTSLNNPDPINDFQTSVSLEQPVFIKKALVGLEMSKTEAAAREEEFKRKREETALKVAQSYLTVNTAKTYVGIGEKAVEDAKEHLRIAEVRYKAGVGLYSDTLRASTTITEMEQKLVSAGKNLRIAKRTLGLLLGMSESADTAGESPRVPLKDTDYYVSASGARKDIKSLELRTENAKKNIALAEAGYYPSVGVGGSYQFNDHNKPLGSEGNSWLLSAFVRWELFDGTKTRHEQSRAKYRAAEAEEYLQGLKKVVSYQVYGACLTVEEAKKNVELSRQALQTAEEGKRLVKVRYENSLSPVVDLLDAQVSLDHARANLIARENEYDLAVITLAYESGTILTDLQVE